MSKSGDSKAIPVQTVQEKKALGKLEEWSGSYSKIAGSCAPIKTAKLGFHTMKRNRTSYNVSSKFCNAVRGVIPVSHSRVTPHF